MQCSLIKPSPRSKYYVAQIKLETWHKARRTSLQTTDKRIAEFKLHELAKDYQKEAMGLLPPRSVREGLRRPLAELLESFLADLESKGRTPATLRKYGGTLRILFERLRWTELRSVTVRSFSQWRTQSTLSAKSLNDLLANLATFFHWLECQGLALENPLKHVQRIDTRGAKQCRRALSDEDASRLIETAPPFRALVYMVALYTGLRRKEINSLRWADFLMDDAARLIRVPASITKNRKEALLPLRDDLAAALTAFKPADAAPFQYLFRNRVPRISTFRKDLSLAGIPLLDREKRRVDFHSLRMTFGTSLLANGVHPRVAMELMRHSDIKLTTKLYTDVSQLPLSAGVAALPSLTQRKWPVRPTQNCTQNSTQTGVSAGRAVSATDTSGQSRSILQSA